MGGAGEGGVFSSPFEASSSAFEARGLLTHIVTSNDKRLRPPNEVDGEISLLAVDCLWPTFVPGLDRRRPKRLSWSSATILRSLNSEIFALTSLTSASIKLK